MVTWLLINKWKKMIKHESVLHVNQGIGKFFSEKKVDGYYNDFRDKVRYTTNLDRKGIPFNIATCGKEKRKVYFPIAIFQYGLGAYDLYLETNERRYLDIAIRMADWAVENQEDNGGWNTFGILGYANKYSSMAQGEATSLLVRAYIKTNNIEYIECGQRAIDLMLKSVNDGGTANYTAQGIVLFEYPGKACVLNGWIFSAFGIFDILKATGKKEYELAWKQSVLEIKNNLNKFDEKYWSYYSLDGKYASRFYHDLHIELLCALNKLDPDPIYDIYIKRWSRYRNNFLKNARAFSIKAMQKIIEKKTDEWILVE